MDQGIINPKNLLLSRAERKDNIVLMPTPVGTPEEFGCIKFNNVTERLSKPRVVNHAETDVEFVFRNKMGSVYAVVYHNEKGEVLTDMLTKAKNSEWEFHNFRITFRPSFANAYISSIYGYRQISELQVAQELSRFFAFEGVKSIIGDYSMLALPGGIAVARCVFKDDEIMSVELFDFVTYESLARDEIKDIYYQEFHRHISGEEMNISSFSEDFLKEILADSVEQMQKKYNK